FVDDEARALVLRDRGAERAALEALWDAGALPARGDSPPRHADVAYADFDDVVQRLLAAGWHAEAEGRAIRPAGAVRLGVSSGVDWFELGGAARFGDVDLPLPALLAAIRRGDRFVELGDGSRGMLPEEWLSRFGLLARWAQQEGRGKPLQFGRGQVGLLDALLDGEAEVGVDDAFRRAREQLRGFDGVRPLRPPGGFRGELRDYQREGLGWLNFLVRFGFGGCLADDMGLGKTVQVLALLEARRTRRLAVGKQRLPSIVVVPRSLVFNWREEAQRFTPRLRLLEYVGAGRESLRDRFADHDLIVTTYGTLRRDVDALAALRFDHAILDEAQAIKNPDSQAARACRRLHAEHRLALTGTPVENRLGDLASIFEFLNPGMMGGAGGLAALADPQVGADGLEVLGRALRPFILRRTKEQVLAELPPRTEQVIHCELEPRQRALYTELRDYYRTTLAQQVGKQGLARAKIHVLEALLRLRQAACHPGLIDRARAGDPSGKLDTLVPLLTEVVDAGHKALVFSQFTSFLALLRERLDAAGMTYEYLDGKTRDRKACVDRFQADAGCPLFLVSLKAGGQGLNLTAADYVFLLDPWWNPAVEAQAIDRAHRIGQRRAVVAYRLIARDTVEDKVLALQASKRHLADALMTRASGPLADLSAEDLEELLA
ncbi:MAG TPA: DEAD/DEAH box helicase, partial [Kofleriaceae bacterium]|nr:DEAD/DEAH box helicase [Kofleriaceae bacterium]